MDNDQHSRVLDALGAAVVRILRPLVRILLRHGVPYGAFADLAKRVYVDIATSELRIGRRKQTISRVAVLTGLTRKEARRVAALPLANARAETERYNRAARVVSGWSADPRFHDEAGAPATLSPDGDFSDLVRCYSGDMPARAVLDELLRVGVVERASDGRVRLCQRAYVPVDAPTDTLEILGTDVAALVATIDHNMTSPSEKAWFQRKVAYDNLPVEALPLLRKLGAEQGQRLLELLNEELRRQDRDCNPEIGGSGRKRVMIGVYYHESDASDDPEGAPE